MTKTPTAVVFDVGNVLIRWDPRLLFRKLFTNVDMTADDAAVERFLTTVCTPEWNVEQDRGRPLVDAVAEATEQAGLSRRVARLAPVGNVKG